MKKTYLLVLCIISLLMFVLYSTYAMFSKDLDIGDLVNLTMSSLPTDSSIQEYERITIEAGDIKTIDLNITNSTTDSLYYGAWYNDSSTYLWTTSFFWFKRGGLNNEGTKTGLFYFTYDTGGAHNYYSSRAALIGL